MDPRSTVLALETLRGELGIARLALEGGGLNGSFLAARLVDELIVRKWLPPSLSVSTALNWLRSSSSRYHP
jgi:hypothetical protein